MCVRVRIVRREPDQRAAMRARCVSRRVRRLATLSQISLSFATRFGSSDNYRKSCRSNILHRKSFDQLSRKSPSAEDVTGLGIGCDDSRRNCVIQFGLHDWLRFASSATFLFAATAGELQDLSNAMRFNDDRRCVMRFVRHILAAPYNVAIPLVERDDAARSTTWCHDQFSTIDKWTFAVSPRKRAMKGMEL